MNNGINPLLSFVIGAGVGYCGGWFSHRFTIRRERLGRLLRFRQELTSLYATLKATSDEDLCSAHRTSAPQVRDLCARITEDIPKSKRTAFEKAAEQYTADQGPSLPQKPSPVECMLNDTLRSAFLSLLGKLIKLAEK